MFQANSAVEFQRALTLISAPWSHSENTASPWGFADLLGGEGVREMGGPLADVTSRYPSHQNHVSLTYHICLTARGEVEEGSTKKFLLTMTITNSFLLEEFSL